MKNMYGTLLIALGLVIIGPAPFGMDMASAQGEGIRTIANKNVSKAGKGSPLVTIKTRHGDIVIKFFPEIAPKHVKSFLTLAKKGFFDGTAFHRVIPGFMIQGGDPNSKDPDARHLHGTGGPGYTIPAEFSARKHTRGILSAARSQDPDSAGSQFFIMVADSPHLDGQYSVFGEVVEGMDVVDKIVNEKADSRDNPIDRVEMISVTVSEAAE